MPLRRLIEGIEMLEHLKNEANIAFTENGAVTNATLSRVPGGCKQR